MQADAQAPLADWQQQGQRFTLRLQGRWGDGALTLPVLAPTPPAEAQVVVAAQAVGHWSATLTRALWRTLQPLPAAGIAPDLTSLPEGPRALLGLALPPALSAPQRQQAAQDAAKQALAAQPLPWLAALGQRAQRSGRDALATVAFLGQVLQSAGRLLRGQSRMRWADLAWQIDQTGPRSVPIVTLVSGLVGLILAYMGAAQLQRFGAQAFIADLVSVGVVREVAALMTGLILSGRVGASFAAQLGSMQANEEVDALRTLGIDPIDHLVLPRVLAMLLVAPLLTAMAAAVGVLAGGLVAVAVFGLLPGDFLARGLDALSLSQVAIGLAKGTLYAVLVALAGCREGLSAGRSAQAVGAATTAAVVKAIVWIVAAASVVTVVLQRLDW